MRELVDDTMWTAMNEEKFWRTGEGHLSAVRKWICV
ncbi:hypothetical protein QG37_07619 [Candidozyma auris]|uniref:Uncharacterized protein n=1 Tax=Candidozyma auris TaxID=498019 RepID=A0A0L0NR27_CANAR|nr:hypothetical protein QG37_07619 [[Candida] auris]